MYTIIIAVSSFDGMNELGGHYFSALTTARELSKNHKVSVFVVGDFLPRTLAVDDVPVIFTKYDASLFCVAPGGIKDMVKSLGAGVVIAFDRKAGVIFRLISAQKGLGFIQVKAGGPVPRTPYIKNPHQIHFSKKDYDWANERVAYDRRFISWIPNRVADMEPDSQGIERLREKLCIEDDDIVLIRIGRLDNKYKPAFIGAINSAKVLRENGFSVRLIMIGAITHPDLCEDLENIMSKDDVLLTGPDYTRNARRFLAIADLNLGVGRGFMEGCAAGNHMLAMAGDSTLPVVVKDEHLQVLFTENFSLRAVLPVNDKQRKADLIALAAAVTSGQKVSRLSANWFKEYFDSSRLNKLYAPVLDAAVENRERMDINLIYDNLIFLLKRFFKRIV
jgi:hypothetical protein